MSTPEDEPITEEQVREANQPDEPAPEPPPVEPEPDDEPDAEPDDEPEPAPQAPPSDVLAEERFKKIGAAAKSYVTRVGGILEEEATDWLPCPLCSDSAVPMLVNVHDAGRVPAPIVDATRTYLGFAREQDYEPDAEVSECPTCKGKGKTLTGSKVPGSETRVCSKCRGCGFYPPPMTTANGTEENGHVLPFPTAASEMLGDQDVDVSGEPFILPDGRPNPNYGKWPQYKIEVPPYGVTAGLTAQSQAG